MRLYEKLIGGEKSVEEFKAEVGAYLSDKMVRVYNIPYKGRFPLDKDFSPAPFVDKNTIYFYNGCDGLYVELGLSGNTLEKELQDKALWDLKRYSPFIRHNRVYSRWDFCELGAKRVERFDIDKENILLISAREFSELLYSTVKLYVELQKKYRDEINEFAVMEGVYKKGISEKEEIWKEKNKNFGRQDRRRKK